MRSKKVRALSVLLTASLVLSSANTGVSALAADFDSNVVEEQQVTEVVAEEQADVQEEASEEELSDTEAQITETVISEEAAVEEPVAEDVTETKTVTSEEAEEETTTEAVEVQSITESTQEQEEELIEEEMEKKLAAAEEALFDKLKNNTSLYQLVLEVYNAATGENLTETNFTYEKLSSYMGDLNFLQCKDPASITSIEGLGCAKRAASINISVFTRVTEIPDDEFNGCAFTSIQLPNTITKIGNKAFLECANLSEITLPDAVTVLGEQAFAKCTSLSAVHSSADNTLPSKLTKLGQQAFSDDEALTEITIPSFDNGSIIQDEPSLFAGCKRLSQVTFGSSITTIPQSAFANAGTESDDGLTVVFQESSRLNKIMGSAFSGAKINETFDLSKCNQLDTIGDSAFENCSGLSTVILPRKTTGTLALENKVFAKKSETATSLTSMYEEGSKDTEGVTLPDYVNKIGYGCFSGNKDVRKLSLSPNLPEIPDFAFDGCTGLTEIEQRQDSDGKCQVLAIGDCAFRSTAITDTEFLMEMNQLETIGYQKLEGLSQYGISQYTADITKISKNDVERIGSLVMDDSNMQKEDTNKQKYDKSKKAYGSEVFTNCSNLKSVHIPSSVKSIGGRAFYFVDYADSGNELRSNIETITWETSSSGTDAERIIYPEAFHGNAKMTTLILPEKTGESLTIGEYAFYGDAALNKIGKSGAEENRLPATVKSIKEGAFYYCQSLANITIQTTEGGECPELGIKVFEKCLSLEAATVPKEIKVIPRHFFYDAPLRTFNVGSGGGSNAGFNAEEKTVGITKIDTLAFFGNEFVKIDLSKYTSLEEIGSGAFAYQDAVVESEERNKNMTNPIYPERRDAFGKRYLTTVILPSDLTQLFINSAAFCNQKSFDTMKAPGRDDADADKDEQIYIPDYMNQSDQEGIFGATGVKKVVWQADKTGNNQWKDIPVNQYEACEEIEKAEDVLPKGTYVETIGKAVFKNSSVQSADLSKYTSLKALGVGSIVDSGHPGVFEGCEGLKEVILPETSEEVKLTIGEKTFFGAVKLETVNLGSTTKLENSVFEECVKLPAITFPETLTEIGNRSFFDCEALKTVDFGSLKKIGNSAFENCTKLVLTESGLPDSLEEIGDTAFKKAGNNDTESANSLGEVRLGNNLKKIGSNAFMQSGMTSIDFTRANSLETIGTSAFSETKLENFNLKNTKVSTISQSLLYGCMELGSAEFGDEVLYMDQNALAGCKNLTKLTFSSTTTVSNRVFYNSYTNPNTQTKEYTANAGSITISVNTPKETVIPLGRSINLPYYISEKGYSNFKYVFVGEGLDESVKEHLSVSAKLDGGYYWGKLSNEDGNKYQISEGEYYTKLDETAVVRRADNNKDVDVIQVTGLKATAPGESFTLSIGAGLTFECADKKMVTANDFSAKYKIVVQDIPFYADLYEDRDRTKDIPVDEAIKIQVSSGTRAIQYYFNITNEDKSMDIAPGTYDVVVETDNENVLYPSNSPSGTKQKSYTTTQGTNINNSTGQVTPNTGSQTFYLVPAGVGTAKIKVYPVGHEGYARTYTYQVDSDIQSITLEIPENYKNGASLGDSFRVFSSYQNCLGQTASASDMSKYSVYSNRKITYTSNAPEYVSMDGKGKITILKADQTNKNVTITATAPNSTGGNVTRTVSFTIKPKINVYVPGTRFEASLYKDDKRAVSVPETEMIQAADTRGIQYYFDVVNKTNTDCDSDTYDIVIETSNPDVLYPSNGASGTKQASCTTNGGTNVNTSTGKVTPNTNRQSFYLIPAGVGTAQIKVYPVGHQDYARTYTYVVNADIQAITLTVPKEYSSGAAPGVSFPIFSSYKNCLGQTVTAADMSNYSVYSNRGIVYTSDAPEYASVDAMGTVTILKADADSKAVTITATAPTSVDGRVVTATSRITVKYPDTKVNEEITDPATGATIAVTKVSKKDLEGEAKFVKPAAGSAGTVKVPDTVMVNGVQYKITTVAENAFKNNTNVKTVNVGKYVTTIEDNAFSGCKKMTKVTIPTTITKIGNKAFYNCKKLKTVTIPKKAKLTEIGDSAFQNCAALKKITIPVGVTKIGAKAFYNCKKLKTITIKSTVLNSVGKNAFKNIHKKATIKVPKKQLAAYKTLLKGKGQKKTVKIKK